MTLMNMTSVTKLKQKIKKLQTERSQLHDEIKKLKLEADGKALRLEEEIGNLRQEAESLRELIIP